MTTSTTAWPALLLRFEHHMLERGKRPKTIVNYLRDLAQYAAWHRDTFDSEPTTLSAVDLHAFKSAQIERRLSPCTVNRRISALKAFSAFLFTAGITERDEAASLTSLDTGPVRAPDVPTHAQLLRLFKMIQTSTWQGKRDFAICQVFVQCGLRLAELIDLELRDVEIRERSGKLRVNNGKGGKMREVPLNATVRAALADWLAARPACDSQKLFVSQMKRGISENAVQKNMARYMKLAGFAQTNCHCLRHTFATRLYNDSKDIVLTQEMLGHSDLKTTLRYTHKTESEATEAVENMKSNILK